MTTTKKHKGSSLESFLQEEDLLEDAEVTAVKRVIAYEVEKAMEKKHVNKSTAAEMMNTSRSQLDRLLDPHNTSVTLRTLMKAAHFVEKKLILSFK